MRAKFVGPVKDYSGYGEACRHDVGALNTAGVDLTLEIPKYTLEIADFGRLGELCMSLEDRQIMHDFTILHVTPNVYPNYVMPGQYTIGRVFWETDKLPLDFAKPCALLDEIWTGSEFNAQAIRNAGVTTPIHIVPEAIDTSLNVDEIDEFIAVGTEGFTFYSIFEWTERKDPSKLLSAFWLEFEHDEGVSLTIKTYIDNFMPDKKNELNMAFKRIKKSLNLDHYAPVYLYRNLMDRHQIYRFHKTFDCFVSAHRGEGWGIPQMEAMLVGNPIISTNLGGIHEYLTDGEDALLVDYNMVNLQSNNRNKQWYTSDQNWGDCDLTDLRKKMRFAYENQKKMKEMGKKARQTVLNKFSLEAVGKIMADRLAEIEVAE